MINAYLQYNQTYAFTLNKVNWCDNFTQNYNCATCNEWKLEYYSNAMITNKPGYDESSYVQCTCTNF